jgi:outer membrane immunogenic protein
MWEVGMRRILFSTISLLALSATGALAADIPRPAPVYKAPVAVAPIWNWTGFYIGINGGYGFGNSDWSGFAADTSPDGWLLGLTLGYNWQTGPWVFGLEGDIAWSDIKGTFANVLCPAGCETKNTWLGTARGRLGYSFGRVMPYVTGGAAFGEIEANRAFFAGASETNVGWTIGAGIEAMLAPNWTAKVEYLHVDLGDIGCSAAACGIASNVNFTAEIIRGGINYKF